MAMSNNDLNIKTGDQQASVPTTVSTVSGRQQMEPNTDYRVVVFGAAGVGKSSLVLRFVRGTFRDSYIPTIEDTYRQVISSSKVVFTLQITDTTGSHQFPAMQRLNIQKGHAFMLVYSINSRQSLEELKPIYREIVEVKGINSAQKVVPIILVGNKCDENSARDVPTAVALKLAQEWGCEHTETSAKINVNVKEAFQDLLKLDPKNSTIFNDNKPNDKSSSQSSLIKNSVNPKKRKESNESRKKKCLLM